MSTLLNDHPLVSTYYQAIVDNTENKRLNRIEDEILEINTNLAEIFEYLEKLDRRVSKRGK